MSRPRLGRCLFALLAVAACGDDKDPAGETGDPGDSEGSTSTGADPLTDPSAPDPTEGPDPSLPATTTAPDQTTGAGTSPDPLTDPGASTGDDTTTTGDGSTGDDTTGGVDPAGPELPTPSVRCPDIVDGMVEFHPDGLAAPRDVRIWIDPDVAAEQDGPVVFYWHGTGGSPNEATAGIGELGIQEILDLGGIVVAPTHDPGAGIFPWYLVMSEKLDDLVLADEVLACAQEQWGVDAARVHSLGFSAGGLHTAQMSIRRSNYIASVTLYSGGLIFGGMPPFAYDDNDFAAMIFHGGPGDQVVVGFQQASEDYAAYLAEHDSFSFICDHGMGHSIPVDETDDVMQFFADHPWGTSPEPYADALPDGFPGYCQLP